MYWSFTSNLVLKEHVLVFNVTFTFTASWYIFANVVWSITIEYALSFVEK